MFPLFISLTTSLLFFLVPAETVHDEWQHRKTSEGISVYFRDAKDSPIKELKMSLEVDANLSTVLAALYDVDRYTEWVYGCLEAKFVGKRVYRQMTYYNLTDFPWPMSDRDVIGHSTLWQDPHSKIVYTHTVSAHHLEPELEGVVRVKTLDVDWVFKPLSKNKVAIDYILKSDPGGNIPAWMINMFLDQGPTRTMIAFRKLLTEEQYRKAKVDYIENY